MKVTYQNPTPEKKHHKKSIIDLPVGTAFVWAITPNYLDARYPRIKVPSDDGDLVMSLEDWDFGRVARFGDSPVYFFEVTLSGEVLDKPSL